MSNNGQLYVVATPIGNLADMTHRAVDTLRSVDLILAEDTRVSQVLLKHYNIQTPLTAFHDHNERQRTDALIDQMHAGKHIALISDAGTPLISDPGFNLIRACREQGINVSPIPGPSACIAAMSVSGIPCDTFTFHGFLPTQEKSKQSLLEQIQKSTHASILYESPRRVLQLLQRFSEHFEPERSITLARELTKKFETVKTGRLDEVLAWYQEDETQHRGEFVVVIGPNQQQIEQVLDDESLRILALLLKELPPKAASKLAQSITGKSHKLFYQAAIEQKS